MEAPRRNYRKKPLAQFEHGTRIYSPTARQTLFRVVATDRDGNRLFRGFADESEARQRAREIEAQLAESIPLRTKDGGQRTVAELAGAYLGHISGRSLRYQERQESLLRRWVLPVIGGVAIEDWTPAASEAAITAARSHLAPSTIQSLGSTMRSLVTFAHKSRRLARENDPMWMVSYSLKAAYEGEAVGFVPRDALPTDEQCADLFAALDHHGDRQWALALRLKHRCGARWGELIGLRPSDVTFGRDRLIRIERAVEQSRKGRRFKPTKNYHKRTTIFPASLTADLRAHVDRRRADGGDDALLFPNTRGGLADRKSFGRKWARAAASAGWKMRTEGSAQWRVHDMRHVAACWMLFDVRLDPATVAHMLGHANPAFTLSRYVGVRGEWASAASRQTDRW